MEGSGDGGSANSQQEQERKQEIIVLDKSISLALTLADRCKVSVQSIEGWMMIRVCVCTMTQQLAEWRGWVIECGPRQQVTDPRRKMVVASEA